MTNPSPFLAPFRPESPQLQSDRRAEASRPDGRSSLAQLIDGAAVAVVGLVLRWIETADDVEHGRAR